MTKRNSNEAADGPSPVTALGERSNLYGLLSAVFRTEPSAKFLEELANPAFQKALKTLGADFGGTELNPEDLAVEYARLFLGPGTHVAPYAVIYLGGEGASLLGPETSWVKDFIEDAGFEYKPDFHDLPDHVSVELEFMQEITRREAAALEKGDTEQAEILKAIEEKFLTHMSHWIPGFCAKVRERAELPFYRAMAALTSDFILSEVTAPSAGFIDC